jgi:hypothetical protein
MTGQVGKSSHDPVHTHRPSLFILKVKESLNGGEGVTFPEQNSNKVKNE